MSICTWGSAPQPGVLRDAETCSAGNGESVACIPSQHLANFPGGWLLMHSRAGLVSVLGEPPGTPSLALPPRTAVLALPRQRQLASDSWTLRAS